MADSRKVLLIGWDSADWRVINPLLDSGKMPHLAELVNGGVIGNLATLYPILSPMLWTSIATGKRPHLHGIHGFAEPDPHTGGVRPITNLSRKTKAVWNILSQNGKRCSVVGWWPSHPAEPLPGGVMVSNFYHRADHDDPSQPWPLLPGSVHPERLSRTLAGLRVHPAELEAEHIQAFVPKAAEVDQEKDRRLAGLAKTIADCTTVQSAATFLMANEPWDFMAVYFDAIDHFGHGFMRYHPPRQKWIPEKDFELYSGVIEAGYRYHDMMLGVLMGLAGPDTTVLLMSDHGFHPDHLRPSRIPDEPAGPAIEHRHYGIFALKGAGIKKDERIYGATVLDICPTLLALFGLPAGCDMNGKPLAGAWERPPRIETVPSWDEIPGDDGSHPPGTRLDAGQAREALKQLEALGYIQPLPEDAAAAVAETDRELRYNLACAYTDAQMDLMAGEIFAGLWSERPDEHRYGAKLLGTQLVAGRLAEARETLVQVRANRKRYAAEAAAELKKRREGWKDRKPDELTPGEQMQLRRLAGRAARDPTPLLQLEARLLMAEGRQEEALAIFEKFKKRGASSPELYLALAGSYAGLKRWEEARAACAKALELDPDNAHANAGLAQIALAQRRNFEAAGFALTSAGLLFHNPHAHFLLGVAMHRLGQIERALQAFQICTAQNPAHLPAHRRLAFLYRRRLQKPKDAAVHEEIVRNGMKLLRERRRAAAARRGNAQEGGAARVIAGTAPAPAAYAGPAGSQTFDPASLAPARSGVRFATIVSGLPRSGTSLMMQMLALGGVPPLHDNHRPADSDNPRGYYEFAPAKNLRMDSSWMPHAVGRALKLVAQLVPFLPPDPPCRVILMERDLEEVLASQKTMLERNGQAGAALASETLRAVYERQLAHVHEVMERRGVPSLRVRFSDCLADPSGVAARVSDFLGLPLEAAAMVSAIEPGLYRNRLAPELQRLEPGKRTA
jgi:predicted AlkP superfamily phosphohydrolase/phosphomutase/tetratricopeptide (TPR) repeat protein